MTTPPVTLVVTTGGNSMERLARALAAHLPVRTLDSDIFATSAGRFGLSSSEALAAARRDLAFARSLRRLRGVVHLPNHHLARYGTVLKRPYVVTVHDLIRQLDRRLDEPLIHRPDRRDRLMLELDVRGIRRASALIAVSRHTKESLVRLLGVPPERITVIPPGVDTSRFRPLGGARSPLPHPYLLFVGSEHPRKNLGGLLRAFRELKREPRLADLRLVKVGGPGGSEAAFRQGTLRALRELGLEREVILRDRVAPEELVRLYSAARCLVLPSLYEGCGLPPLEAMACGCPVIVSDRTALPELAGPGALVSDPRPERLAAAIARLLDDPVLARRLAREGRRHVRHLTWERAAESTMEVYERLLGAEPGTGPARPPAPEWRLPVAEPSGS